MNTAYDLKDLQKKLVEAGLPEVEKLAEKSYGALMAWIVESAVLSPGKIDDIIVGFKAQIDALVLPQLDKIDHKEG